MRSGQRLFALFLPTRKMTDHLKIGCLSMTDPAPRFHEYSPLLWLALGTFATGTESFMIAALLPGLAADLSVSVTAAGQLVTVFALVYALSSPLLSAATSSVGRRKLLLLAMGAFALANVVASAATDYWQLMTARILLACAAGLYVPSASALAGALVSPARRGTALAIVNGGTSIAVALGVPLGAIVGHGFGWRMTFLGVAILASIATVGLLIGLPRSVGAGLTPPSLRERIAVVQQPPILIGLLVTTIWAAGAYTIYTYLAPYLKYVTGIEGSHVGLVLFVWGVAAATGLAVGGAVNDRFGARAVMIPAFLLLALAFFSLSVSASFVSGTRALAPVLVAIVVWGLAAWGFFPAQQARLVQIAGLKVAPVVLSLNASFMYLGFSLGAALGSFTLIHGAVTNLGWVGALCEILALLIVLATVRSGSTSSLPATPSACRTGQV
jgi:predicted MFS family arabinose efflux permease